MIAWKLNSFGILALATANAVCAEPLLVTSATPLGLQPDGRYHVQLQGSFDSPADVVPTAICDGKPVPSVMHAATQTMIEISIPLQRVPLLCSFIAHRLTDGAISLPSIQITSSGDNQIRGSVDRGRIGTRHGMELYGSFPAPQSLNLSIYCVQGGDINRTTMPYTAEIQFDLRSPTQINLTFNDVPGVGARCSFTPIDASGRATGPLWGPIALSSNDSYITANFGAYHWPLGAAVGPDADDALMPGQQWLARAGFNIARVWMSPLLRTRISNAANPYHLNLDVFCAAMSCRAPALHTGVRLQCFSAILALRRALFGLSEATEFAEPWLYYSNDWGFGVVGRLRYSTEARGSELDPNCSQQGEGRQRISRSRVGAL